MQHLRCLIQLVFLTVIGLIDGLGKTSNSTKTCSIKLTDHKVEEYQFVFECCHANLKLKSAPKCSSEFWSVYSTHENNLHCTMMFCLSSTKPTCCMGGKPVMRYSTKLNTTSDESSRPAYPRMLMIEE